MSCLNDIDARSRGRSSSASCFPVVPVRIAKRGRSCRMLFLNTRDQQAVQCQKHVPPTIRTPPATSWLRLEIQAATRPARRRLLEGIWLNKACGRSRMLKKSASHVLASLRDSTMRETSSETRSETREGLFRLPRTIDTDKRLHKVRAVPPRLFDRCGRAGRTF